MNQNGHTTEESPVRLQRDDQQVLLYLPPAPALDVTNDWAQLWQHLNHRLKASEKFWEPQTLVAMQARDRLLDGSQLSAIAQALKQVDLHLSSVETTRRQTAVAAATAGYSVIQPPPVSPQKSAVSSSQIKHSEPLYLKTTVRSGMEVRHEGTIILCGDVNPGGAILAQGDIIIWGRLRGLAHAGIKGDRAGRIFALQLQPTQLRIADTVARAPNTPPQQQQPEIAYIADAGIRITRGLDFAKSHRFVTEKQCWEDLPV
ncbi:septum site-determining protein MinC [Halothece sp. PCC 7418]|uniref:septum site-determining protein MinC n=1 Tax=Halothece sp. (strain PCC 7418) TaxID=65093 RepID=UPI0002A08236|nr:septum site-determining protein MinC [Halothece sp. PCC 7418]AFZ43785.1 septum site-determining protein MinC [Halothece sp. PCC 7418]